MFFRRVFEPGLAQASYIIGCQATGDAIVIDPRRDIDVYLEIADHEGLTIKAITETHIHADFLSGSRELAAATGAEIYASDEGGPDWQYRFPHRSLRDGDVFYIGNLKFEVMHTPGHTPEHISFLLTDQPAGDHPIMIFTGDFVFVGDVGRPDLLEEAAGIKGTKEAGPGRCSGRSSGSSPCPTMCRCGPAMALARPAAKPWARCPAAPSAMKNW